MKLETRREARVPGRWRRTAALMLVALVLVALPALAQGGDSRVEQLEKEVAALKAEVARMAAAGPGGDAERLAEVERRLEVLAEEIEQLRIGEAAVAADQSENGMGPAASKVYHAEKGLSIGGYGEVLYQHFDDEEATDELDLLRAVLYFGYKWNDRWLFNSEIEYEHGGEEIGVEFAYLDYLWRPQASFRAGMVLLPVGFLNELHEPTVFLGARRPDVERVILPTTWHEDGIGLFGSAGPFTYRTYVVNGFDATGFAAADGLREGRQGGAETKADDLAWVGRLDYTAIPGLLVGASAYFGDSGQDLEDAAGGIGVGTSIVEGHLEWRWRGLEFRALGVEARLDDVARLNAALGLTGDQSVGERLRGHYLQAGYDLFAGRGQGERSFVPFLRWERFDTQDQVPAGFAADPANDVESWTAGFAFKPIDALVLKVDFQDYDNGAGTGADQLNVALGYIF